MSDFQTNAGWEVRDGRTICRWIMVWQESDDSIVGCLGGYSGGGTFQLEQFLARFDSDKLSSLMIDTEDKITGDEIEFFDDVPEELLAICDDAQDHVLSWHDQEEWEDAEQLLLKEEHESSLTREGDMLLYSPNTNRFLREILELSGITAGPRSSI